MKIKKKYDVAVVGLGAMGSAAVYQMAARGTKVLGIDAFSPPHHFGSSFGGSRIIRQAYFEDNRYVPLLKRSYALWNELEQQSNTKLLSITGALMMGSANDKVLTGSYDSALQYHIASDLLPGETIRKKFPQFHPDADMMALLDHTAGFINPEKAIKATLELSVRMGADIQTDERVSNWKNKRNGYLEINTTSQTYQANQLVICVGAWTKKLLPQLKVPLQPERVVQCWMQPIGENEMFAIPNFPVFLIAVNPELALYGIPSEQPFTQGVKVALHPMGPFSTRNVCDPDTVNREVTQDDLNKVRYYLKKYVPALDGKCIDASVCLYTNTPDLHPVIDFYPDNPKVIIAAGFSGHGFKFSNVVGEIICELVMAGKSALRLDIFKIDRLINN